MEIDILKKLQNTELAILKEVVKICEENNIRYFAIAGTCIGSIRHSGFIPWDDDIDIAMPRKDYELFLQIAPHTLPNHLSIQHYTIHKKASHGIIRVMDKNTTWLYKGLQYVKDTNQGILIDILPLDGISSSKKEQKKIVRKTTLLNLIDGYYRFPVSRISSLKAKIFYLLFQLPIRAIFGWFIFINKVTNILKQYDFDTSDYIIFGWRKNIHLYYERSIFKKIWFSDFVYKDFEDIKIRCPIDYDAYLKHDYGDYMQFPPESARIPDHDKMIVVLDFEHSYLNYNNKIGKFE
jgi:lipopolysaccharide cholinephosphotransferase